MSTTRSRSSATRQARRRKQPARKAWLRLLGVFVLGSALVGCGAGSFALPPGLPPVAGGGLLAILTTEAVDGIQGRLYLKRIETSGSTPPLIACTITLGALPPGLNIGTGASVTPGNPGDDDECIISGTPTSTGTFTFTVEVRDSSLATQRTSEGYSITIRSEFEIASFQVVDAVAGRNYSKSFKVLTNLSDDPNPAELGSNEQGNGPITACSITGLPANMGFTCAPDSSGVALDVTLTNTGVLAATGPVALTLTITDTDIVQSGLVVVAGRALTNATTSPSFAIPFTIRSDFALITPSLLQVVDAVFGRTYTKSFTFTTNLQDNGDDDPNDVGTGEPGNGPLTDCAVTGLPADFTGVCTLDPGGLTGTIDITSAGVTTAPTTLSLALELTDSPIPQASPLQVGPVVPERLLSLPFGLTIRDEFAISNLGLGGGTVLPDAVEDRAYDFTFTVTTNTVTGGSDVAQTAENGNGPVTACVVTGLPPGLVPTSSALTATGCTIRIQGTVNINPPTAPPSTFSAITLSITDTAIPQASVTVVPANTIQQLGISLTVRSPLVMTLATNPAGGTFNDATSGGVAPDAVSGRPYGAPRRDLLFSVTGGIPPYNWATTSAAPAPIACAQEGANNSLFRCKSGGANVTGATSNLGVSVTEAGSGGVTPLTLTTDNQGHSVHTINVRVVLALAPNGAVSPPPPGVRGRTYGNTGSACPGPAPCIPLTYTASGGLLPYVPSLPASVAAPAVNGVPAAVACSFATPVATCTTGASTLTAATGTYPFEVRVVDTANDTTAQGLAAVSESVTISAALQFFAFTATSPATISPAEPFQPFPPLGVEGRTYADNSSGMSAIGFEAPPGLGLGGYTWDTPVAGLPGDLECILFTLVQTNDILVCFAQAVSGGAALPQPTQGNFPFVVTLRDPGNAATPAGAQSIDDQVHANHTIVINPPLALAVSVGTLTDLPEGVNGRNYADPTQTCTGPAACQALVYTGSGGLGDPTLNGTYAFSFTTGLTTPGVGFPDTIGCNTGTNPNADELTCAAAGVNVINVVTPGTYQPAVAVDDAGNATTPSGGASSTTAIASRNLEVNAALNVALVSPSDPPPLGANARSYGNAFDTCAGAIACAPLIYQASGGLGDPTVDGSYLFTESATGLTAPGAGFPNPIACLAGTNPIADQFDCFTAAPIAVTTTGLYTPGVTVDDLANETTPSGTDSGTTDSTSNNLTLNPALEFEVRIVGLALTPFPGVPTDPLPEGVVGRTYADVFGAGPPGIPRDFPYFVPTPGRGLGGYVWGPAGGTLPSFVSCFQGLFTGDDFGCLDLSGTGTPQPIPGNFTFTVTLSDTANASTPSGAQSTDNQGHTSHTIVINPILSITSLSPLDSATDGEAYLNQLLGAGGLAASHAWSVFGEAGPPFPLNSGDTDCDGLSMDAAALISGTSAPTPVDNNCPFTAQLDDAGNTVTPDSSTTGGTGLAALDLPVAGAGSPVIDNDVLINGLEGFLYTQSFTATGGGGGNAWVEAGSAGVACPTPSGAVPTGTALGGATGILTGTSTPAGTFDFGVCVEDAFGGFNLKNYTLVINQPNVYVTNAGSDDVTPIDFSTDIASSNISVGATPRAVAITPDGTRAYVTNQNSDDISVIDTLTNQVAATIPIGTNSLGIALHPDGTRAYATSFPGDSVIEIDITNNTVTGSVSIDPGGDAQPRGIAVTSDGAFAYVADSNTDRVSVLDLSSSPPTEVDTVAGGAVTPITVGNEPHGVAVNPDGTRVYVTNNAGNSVSVINTATNTVLTTISLGAGTAPEGITVTPDGTRAYVAQEGDNIRVINLQNNTDDATTPPQPPLANTILATITLAGTAPQGIDTTPDGLKGYEANVISDDVQVIDTDPASGTFNTLTGTVITVGTDPESELGVAAMRYPVLHFTRAVDGGSGRRILAQGDDDQPANPNYSDFVRALGGIGSYLWAEVAGQALSDDGDCTGLSLNTGTGEISGDPNPAGGNGVKNCDFSITVTDSATVPQTITGDFRIIITED